MGFCCCNIYMANNNNTIIYNKKITYINEIFETNDNNQEKPNNNILSRIIQDLKKENEAQVNSITIIELFNLVIYQNNNNNNDYLVFDMRSREEQTENYIKKIKPINITVNELLKISHENIGTLQSSLNNKKIIIIPENTYDNLKNLCQQMLKIGICNGICLKILNTNLLENNSNKLIQYLSVCHSYDNIPYILFTYQHFKQSLNEGYFFISFLNNKLFSLKEYVNELNQTLVDNNNTNINICSSTNKFFLEMKITTIFNIDNRLKNELDIKEYNHNNDDIFKEIIINKNDIKNEKDKINEIVKWLDQEMNKGHSCYFNIQKNCLNDLTDSNQENNWIFIIIILITLVTKWEYIKVIDYLKEKMVYINNIDEIFNNNNIDDEIKDTLLKY